LGKKYSEVKHEDKFHEALSKAWDHVQGYALPAGIAAGLLLVSVIVWMVVAQHRRSGIERVAAERFEIGRRYADIDTSDEQKAKEQSAKQLAELEDFAARHQGSDVAAVTLLEVARQHLTLAEAVRGTDPDAAEDHLKRAAKAAEQFLADYPEHPHVAQAHYDAGKARLDLKQYERAARHFEEARHTDIAFLATLAQFHAGLCYEKSGELAKARAAFETVRDSKGFDGYPTWCADQAEFHLTRLGRTPEDS